MIPPTLPPRIECACEVAFEADGIFSISGITPSPPLEVDTGPQTTYGASVILTTLRMYADPTFSVEISQAAEITTSGDVGQIPASIPRYWLETSTEYLGNKIQARSCFTAGSKYELSNPQQVVPILQDYCVSNVTAFDYQVEPMPVDVTHVYRFSTLKYKFATSPEVFIRCIIRACEELPCGTCNQRRRGLLGEDDDGVDYETTFSVSTSDGSVRQRGTTRRLGAAAPPVNNVTAAYENWNVKRGGEGLGREWSIQKRALGFTHFSKQFFSLPNFFSSVGM